MTAAIHAFRLARRKRHGAGRAPVKEALFLALSARSIAQRRPQNNPLTVWPWRWVFGGGQWGAGCDNAGKEDQP